jgi:hypothetical protein
VARLKQSIFSPEFSARHKKDSRHFIRKRKLPFPTITLILMNMLKGALQDESDHFLKAVKGAAVRLFLETDPLDILRDLIDMLVKTVEPIRTGRRLPRKHRTGGKLFNPGYKPCL